MRLWICVRLLLTCLLCSLWLPPMEAAAAPADDGAAEQFKEAQELFKSESYEAALPKFRAVLEQSDSPNARLYVARCLKELGRLVEAYGEMDRTVRESNERAAAEPKYAQTRNAAAAQLAMLEPLVGKLVIAVAEPSAGAEVLLNGEPVSADRLGMVIPFEPGPATIVATAPGKQRIERRAEVVAGQTATITVVFEEEVADPQPQPVPPVPDEESTGGQVRVAGYVVGAVGVAAMAAFVITGVMAQSKLDELEQECGGARCTDLQYADTVDDGETLQVIANVSLVAGVALIVGGTAMVIFGGPTAEPQSAWLDISPSRGMVHYRYRF